MSFLFTKLNLSTSRNLRMPTGTFVWNVCPTLSAFLAPPLLETNYNSQGIVLWKWYVLLCLVLWQFIFSKDPLQYCSKFNLCHSHLQSKWKILVYNLGRVISLNVHKKQVYVLNPKFQRHISLFQGWLFCTQ